jgi:hypothetical protein
MSLPGLIKKFEGSMPIVPEEKNEEDEPSFVFSRNKTFR